MVTALSFMHIRSIRGLGRRVRKLAKKLKHVLHELHEESKLADEHLKEGEEKAEFKEWKKMLELYEKEDEYIDDISQKEFIIFYEEIKEENDEEKKLEKVKSILGENDHLLDPVINDLKDIKERMNKLLNILREHGQDLFKFRERIVRYINLFHDDSLDRYVYRLARFEVHDIKDVQNEEGNFRKALNELEHAKPEDLQGKADKLKEISAEMKKSFLIELEHTEKLFHYVDIIHMRLLQLVYDKAPLEFERLHNNGFNDSLLKELNEEQADLVVKMRDHLYHLYKMIRFDQRET